MPTLCGIRGATTVAEDTPTAIEESLSELFSALADLNGIAEDDVVSVFLTVTHDIHSISPAKILRQQLGWNHTPIMCSLEPDITGLPGRCIRVLIQFNTQRPRAALKPVYQRGATSLRPDLK